MRVTTSWDDGTAEDMKIVTLLDKYHLKGTFYICPKIRQGKEVLSSEDIKKISKHHEVGAHTLTHPHLTQIPLHEAKREIEEGKKMIESITDKPCTMFCYPYGSWNNTVKEAVQSAGYLGARTTESIRFNYNDPFLIPTTIQVRSFPRRKEYSKWWHPLDPFGPLRFNFRKLQNNNIPIKSMGNWLSLAKSLFIKARTDNTVFHIWGHSSEIEKLHMWDDLEALFVFIAEHDNVDPVVNSELLL